MQNLKILQDKLNYVLWFFRETTTSFREDKRKIEFSEPPFDVDSQAEWETEPQFLEKWIGLKNGIDLQGQLCINLVQRSMREYLDSVIAELNYHAPNRGGDWFHNYQKWFLEIGADWIVSSANLSIIEEITIARNCIQHGSSQDLAYLLKRQNADYFKKFPNARFTSDLESRIFGGECGPKLLSIEVTEEKLQVAVREVLKLCEFIEDKVLVKK